MTTDFTFDVDLFSDFHKDVYGSRPRGHEFYSASDERKQEIWDNLCAAHEIEMQRYDEERTSAINKFEEMISEIMKAGAPNRETAIRWIIEAENFDEYDLRYGGDYITYYFNLPCEWRGQFDDICSEMLKKLETM